MLTFHDRPGIRQNSRSRDLLHPARTATDKNHRNTPDDDPQVDPRSHDDRPVEHYEATRSAQIQHG
jgi:hypothetical protein